MRANRRASAAGLALGLCLSPAASSCRPEPLPVGPAAALDLEIDHGTDGTAVRNKAGSVWRGTATLIPEVHIGVDDGPPELVFGRIADFELTADHIFVLEAQPPVVRQFDHNGNWIADFGGPGKGPGEFEWPAAIAVDAKREWLYVKHREPRQLVRISTNDGRPSVLQLDLHTAEADIVVTTAGLARTVVLDRGEDLFSASLGLEWLPLDGEDATRTSLVASPEQPARWTAACAGGGGIAVPIPFAAELQWALFRDGGYVVGTSDEYRFVIHSADGAVRTVEKYWYPIAASAAEREWRTRLARSGASCGGGEPDWEGPEAPTVKRAFDSLFHDGAGRIWVLREGPGRSIDDCARANEPSSEWWAKPCWEAPTLVDIFDEEGRYLGPLEAPEGLRFHPRPMAINDRILAVTLDEAGNPRLTWHRLALPATATE